MLTYKRCSHVAIMMMKQMIEDLADYSIGHLTFGREGPGTADRTAQRSGSALLLDYE